MKQDAKNGQTKTASDVVSHSGVLEWRARKQGRVTRPLLLPRNMRESASWSRWR